MFHRPRSPLPSCQRSPLLRLGIAFGLLLLWSGVASGHDLEVDELSFHPAASGTQVMGQLIFDPELTREPQATLSAEIQAARVLEFVEQQLRVSIDGSPCALEPEVRELDNGSGAVPGDIVQLKCSIRKTTEPHRLVVSVGEKLGPLFVNCPSLDPSGLQMEASELTQAGSDSPVFRFYAGVEAVARAAQSRAELEAKGAAPAPRRASLRPWYEVVADFIYLGFIHIIPLGLDHMLFVLGVVLGVKELKRLALELTLFTLAHSVTLGLAGAGLLLLPAQVVEPLIALSIALLGVETLLQRPRVRRLRLPLIFGFGLVHGLGFGGILLESAPELGSFLFALLGFNLGVELAQFVFALLVFALLVVSAKRPGARERMVELGSALLILVGLYWSVTRVFFA